MSCRAMLMKVNNHAAVRARLPRFTSREADELIQQAEHGHKPVITDVDCDVCKKVLEQDDAAVVHVEHDPAA